MVAVSSPEVAAFPYVNGGLFADDIIIPQFTEDTRFLLLQEASADFDWSGISPTIFGAVFESTLNPETRRSGGMHYTSVENIHKLTGPLFYNDLKAELAVIQGLKSEKERRFKLGEFRKKLASLKFLDPACGSGNFLTETYLSLRKLENQVLEDLYGGQLVLGGFEPIMVSIDQFYGIEINDFAVEVAKTALWIAELQMIDKTREILDTWIDPLPLKSNDNIVCANALRIDWNDVLPASECNYIMGNPPFIGARFMAPSQKDDLEHVFGNWKNSGDLDYVSCWFERASRFMANTEIDAALVSTNSITQGLSVGNLWTPLFSNGLTIIFAYRSFVWDSEAAAKAHVHCIIVGFTMRDYTGDKLIFGKDTITKVSNINGYLLDGPNIAVGTATHPICDVPEIGIGNLPIDDGNYLFSKEEMEAFLLIEPGAAKYFHPWYGAKEFINRKPRYCLWLGDCTEQELADLPQCRQHIENVRQFRLSSKRKSTVRIANKPAHFWTENMPKGTYIVIPQVSSERRRYIPMGYMDDGVLCSDKVRIMPEGNMYHFGVLESRMHTLWAGTVCTRLKSDYSYTVNNVYNNFIWPDPTPEQRERIEACAQAVLDARDNYPDKSLADLYDPDKMPADLLAAHKALDAAVEAAYGVDFQGDEEKIVAHLFKLYAEKTKEEGDD